MFLYQLQLHGGNYLKRLGDEIGNQRDDLMEVQKSPVIIERNKLCLKIVTLEGKSVIFAHRFFVTVMGN